MLRVLISGLFLCVILVPTLSKVTSICPNSCSSNGVCTNISLGTCGCFPGFTGFDCSLRVCPSSTAWVDMPSDNYTAHAEFSECSNMVGFHIVSVLSLTFISYISFLLQGTCDRTTGLCKCRTGFEGAACDISTFNYPWYRIYFFFSYFFH
jgi:hypothetical protein